MVAKVKYTPKLKGNAERERDRESERERVSKFDVNLLNDQFMQLIYSG